MQHCNTADLFTLARTCRHTLAAASDAFAWRGDRTLIEVRMRSPADAVTQVNQLARRNRNPLLRRAPISLHWRVTGQDGIAV